MDIPEKYSNPSPGKSYSQLGGTCTKGFRQFQDVEDCEHRPFLQSYPFDHIRPYHIEMKMNFVR